MKQSIKYLFVFCQILLSACSQDKCREYSDFTCEQIEASEYNVYFYYPNNQEAYLGHANSLSACGSIAHGFAYSKKLASNSDWSYICCMIANDSKCYEKHR